MLFIVASCGPIPRPFQSSDAEKAQQTLTQAPVIAPVLVAPQNTSLANGNEIAENTAELLRQNGIVASANPDLTNAYLLMFGDDGETLVWELFTQDGEPILFLRTQNFPRDFEPESESLYISKGPIETLISPLRHALGLTNPATHSAAAPLTLGIGEIRGAPGDGNKSLYQAIEETLLRRMPSAYRQSSNADLILDGLVSTQNLDAERIVLRIDWTVSKAVGGAIAELTQENPIPISAIEKTWGPLSWDIALATIPDIAKILKAASASR